MQENIVPFGQNQLYNVLYTPQGATVLIQYPSNQNVVTISNLPVTIANMQHGYQTDNGKTKESDTNVYINRTSIEHNERVNTEQLLEREIKITYGEMRETPGYPSSPDFPKVTFPKKDGIERKKKYLFVDFENEDQNLGKRISREFIKRFNSKFGENVAQCAKEKDQEENNIYFEPLPRGTSKEALKEIIVAALGSYQPVDAGKWSVYVKETDKSKYPVGFCRIENDSKIVDEIIRKMNRKSWDELGMSNIRDIDTNTRASRLTKLIVKKANRNPEKNIRTLDTRSISHSLTQLGMCANPTNTVPLTFQQQIPSPTQPMINQTPALHQPQPYDQMNSQLKYEHPTYNDNTTYNSLWAPHTPRSTMHNAMDAQYRYQRQEQYSPHVQQPVSPTFQFSGHY